MWSNEVSALRLRDDERVPPLSATGEENLWSRSGRDRGWGSGRGTGWGRSPCRSQRLGGDSGRRVAFEGELPHALPLKPNEDLHFIRSGQPVFCRRFPFSKAI